MKISFITDEATQNVDEAIGIAVKTEIDGLELRSIDNIPIDKVPFERLLEIAGKIKDAGLSVPCVSSSFYKCDFGADLSNELEKLDRLCRIANIFECEYIRGFAFFKSERTAVSHLKYKTAIKPGLRLLAEYNKTLLLEADPSVNTRNHRELASLIGFVESPFIQAVFDPGNDLYDPLREPPYPDGYEYIKPYIRHIHIKDARYDKNGKPYCVKIGDGLVGYDALIPEIAASGYDGWMSVETHYRKEKTLSDGELRQPQGAEFSRGGAEATIECIEALKTLLKG